jgi:hypothetical protein
MELVVVLTAEWREAVVAEVVVRTEKMKITER